jgi:hypothetical protein
MGNKGAKLPKKPTLSSKDLKQLSAQTGLTKEQIQTVFDKFNTNNPGFYQIFLKKNIY